MPIDKTKAIDRLVKWTARIAGIVILLVITFRLATHLKTPVNIDKGFKLPERTILAPNFYKLGNNWLRKSNSGLWELYIEGNPFDRGVANGVLARDLIFIQEDAFIRQIKKMIPSEFYLKFLKYLTYWFDRKIDRYVPAEYLQEIYGISLSASDNYDFIGKKYDRILNYHAAHDIGHAMQNYHLVGCTSFAAWGGRTSDSSLILARNFDFFVGDEFAKNKIVTFYNPDQGYKFVFISWGAMTGVVSGMNEKGLTVTINAAKSKIPSSAAVPISLIVREVLQYASNINEAFEIVKRRKAFVSESLLVGSAFDHMAAIIEKSPVGTQIYKPAGEEIICTNHFQSEAFRNDPENIDNIRESASMYRYKRTKQLLDNHPHLNVFDAAGILRDQKGLNNSDIGMGNEKAVNQLIAHHSIIFQPEKLRFWISTYPFQIGAYVCYDLNTVFRLGNQVPVGELYNSEQTIYADTMLYSVCLKNYRTYREALAYFKKHLETIHLNASDIAQFISLNPQFYEGYALVAEYFQKNNELAAASNYYQLALNKEIPDEIIRGRLKKSLDLCNKRRAK